MNMFPIQIVKTGEERLVERFGKYNRTLKAGIHLMIPFVELTRSCSIKQGMIDTPESPMITKDNVSVNINAVIFFQVKDSYKALYNIENYKKAVSYSAITNLRSIIGSMTLDNILSERKKINNQLSEVLDKITDKYGLIIYSIEIQDIELSDEIEEAMNLEKSASLKKKALILESEGKKQSQIEKSEGLKRAMILEAEGNKEKLLLEAEAEAQCKEKIAVAEAVAMKKIINVFDNDSEKYLQLKQLEGIVEMSKGDSTKLIIPNELLSTVGSLSTLIEGVKKPVKKIPKKEGKLKKE